MLGPCATLVLASDPALTRNFPTALVSRWVPPAPGISPILTSGKPNFALVEENIMSHSEIISPLLQIWEGKR